MRANSLLLASLLLLVGTVLAAGGDKKSAANPFGKDKDYFYQYNAQITSGLIAQSDADGSADPQQKASTRIQAQAKFTFTSDRHVQLRLQQIRVAQLNQQMARPEQVQPMSIFEPMQIPAKERSQLEQPCQFSYANGVIERVQFGDNDDAWSKNIKRAVLNMIQLNLKKNNEQGLRPDDEQPEDEDGWKEQSGGGHAASGQMSQLSRTFSIPEITVEGACQTTYAVNKAGQPTALNVTKTIDFKQCSRIADIAYGYQTQQQQPQCAACQQQYSFGKQQQKQQSEPQQPGQQHPCENKCDPKEVKEQTMDRSTVLRYQLTCQSAGGDCPSSSKNYALERTELLSQYVYKNMKAESGSYGSAMHTVVAASLHFQSAQPKGNDQVPAMSSGKVESLMYSNEEEVDVKRFYMYGDEEYPQGAGKTSQSSSSPFHQVPKVQQAERALRKLAQTITGDKQKGIELQAGIEVQRLVESLRMCSVEELKRIEQNAVNGAGTQMNGEEQKKAKHIYTDSLAICGTRNCVQQLAEKIQKKDISQPKAIQALKSVTGLAAPSESIVKIVERLCKHETVHRQKQLKQACWLAFGALVNELCQYGSGSQKNGGNQAFGAQSGFDNQKQCQFDSKQQYKESILNLYNSADSTYDKMVALSALGNAGIDISVGDLEQIIKNQAEEDLVRAKAADALRRLRTQMPIKVQEILLPIFANTREAPSVRAAALSTILGTFPEQKVIDQLVYILAKESNQQVQAFTYRAMKALSNSQNPTEQQISAHIKNALKLANVDEQKLRTSGKWQLPMFSQDMQEGVFFGLAQMVSSRSGIPGYAHATINTYLNDQFSPNQFMLYMAQQDAEQWYQNAMGQSGRPSTRGDRQSSASANYGQPLRDIYSALGIKSRRSSPSYSSPSPYQQQQQQQQQPFAMLAVRSGDVDHGFVAIDEEGMPEFIRQVVSGQAKPTLSRFLEHFQQQQQQQQQYQGAIVGSLAEREATVPTSAGLSLRVLTSLPALATVDGQLKVNSESVEVNGHVMANLVHIQKMECHLPFAVSGVESIRSLELNAPLQAEMGASQSEGNANLRLKLPRSAHTLLGLHSLPFTYTAEVDTNTQLTHEPRRIQAIHQPKLDRMQQEADTVLSGLEQLGIPIHVQGHYHWPAQQASYQQFLQMQMATENAVHVSIRPNQHTPREAVFRIAGSAFQKTNGQLPQLQTFYEKQLGNAWESAEQEDIEMENQSQRHRKLQQFLGQYQPQQQYKHSVKVSAQTIGGTKECKAEATLQSTCDGQLQACNVQLNAHRTPLGRENQKWTFKMEGHMVMPETVDSVQELAKLQQKNSRFQCQAQTKWGAERKQEISIRMQAENVKRAEWRQAEQQNRRIQRQAAFLNKYDFEAEYNLKPEVQNAFGRILELVKSTYFWNSQSKLTDDSRQGSNKVLASIIIDPVTQKHANATVKTPGQIVRLQQIELPTRVRPFPLIRQQSPSTNSIAQFLSRIAVNVRAECTVDGRQVNTFDDVEYNAPLSSNCYSVIAKDCGSEEPEFAVLMKAIESGKDGQKKLKVIGQQQQITCQKQQKNGRIACKENGTPVNREADSDAVHFNNAQQTDVTVHLGGISVRFNGRKAWLKVSSMYKNSQCGLCGHYDESADDENEWRMGNNQKADDLAQFHRSYTLRGANQYSDEEGEQQQCDEQQLDNFYQRYGSAIGRNVGNSAENEEDEEEWENEQFNGEWDESDEEQYQSEWENTGSISQENNNNKRKGAQKHAGSQEPVKETRVLEMNHQICFSQQPVKQCPKGTVAVYNKDAEDGENTDDSTEEGDSNGRSVRFGCAERSSPEARKMLSQVERSGKVEGKALKQLGNSITQNIAEPKKCMRNRF